MHDGVDEKENSLPLAEESLTVTTRTVETGRVRVALSTETHLASAPVDLKSERVVVERLQLGHVVTEVPVVREVDGLTIIPVVEEILVKQLVLREEIHVRRIVEVTQSTETHSLRKQTATIDRLPPKS